VLLIGRRFPGGESSSPAYQDNGPRRSDKTDGPSAAPSCPCSTLLLSGRSKGRARIGRGTRRRQS